MSFDHKDVSEDKRTGFTYKGREITLSKTRGASLVKTDHHKVGYYSDNKRIEVTTLYAALGHCGKVAELAKIPESTVRAWRKTAWFKELLDEIHEENDEKIDAKFTNLVEKSLDQLGDRIENGDYVLDKFGELHRKPVGARDLALVTAINIDKRQLLRGKPTSRSESVTTEGRLANLAEQFVKLAKNQKPVVLEVTNIETVPNEDATHVAVDG